MSSTSTLLGLAQPTLRATGKAAKGSPQPLVQIIARMVAALLDGQSRMDLAALGRKARELLLDLLDRLDRAGFMDAYKRHGRITLP